MANSVFPFQLFMGRIFENFFFLEENEWNKKFRADFC